MRKLSCIVPVYNVEEYVIECLDSIYNQDYPNIEIIIVDDGSTDSSLALIQKWMQGKNNISLVIKNNGGLSDARNFGLEKANGDYITFVDSDDVLLNKNLFSNAINILDNNPDCDIFQYNMILRWKSEDAHPTKYNYGTYKTIKQKAEAYSDLTIHGSCCDKIFRANIFSNLRFAKGVISEDIFLIPELIKNSNEIIVSNLGYYGYRYRPGSLSKSNLNLEKEISQIRSYCRYWAFLDQYSTCRKNFYPIYVKFIWDRTAILSKSFSHRELQNFYSSKTFLKKSFLEWTKSVNNIKGLKNVVKSFWVFVIKPINIDRLHRLLR